jgi:hypothetical protein
MMVRPSSSWKLIWIVSVGGGTAGPDGVCGRVMNTKGEGLRIVVSVDRSFVRAFSPGAGLAVVMVEFN